MTPSPSPSTNLAFKDQSRSRGRGSPANVTLGVAMKFRDLLDTARQTAGDTVYGNRVQAIIAELQPRDEFAAQKRQKEGKLKNKAALRERENSNTRELNKK